MKDFIIGSLEIISKVAIILMVGTPFVLWTLNGHPLYGLLSSAISFVISVVVFGVLFVLLEINDHLRQIRHHFETAPLKAVAKDVAAS